MKRTGIKKRYIITASIFFLICSLLWPSGGIAKGPLFTKNMYALYIPFINLTAESAECLNPGELDIRLSQNYANTFRLDFGEQAGGFMVLIDVENYNLNLNINYGITSCFDMGFECSFITQSGGFFDPYIIGFHNIFGFPNSGRDKYIKNNYGLVVSSANHIWFNVYEPSYGINSLTVKGRLNLVKPSTRGIGLSVQPALKMPLGGEEDFLTNNKTDFAVSLLADIILYRFRFYINGGWMYLGRPENVPEQYFNNHLFRYIFGTEWILTDAVSLNAQLNGSSSPYNAVHRFLGDHSITLNLGGKVVLFPRTYIQFSFTEELFSYSATDIQFSISTGFIF